MLDHDEEHTFKISLSLQASLPGIALNDSSIILTRGRSNARVIKDWSTIVGTAEGPKTRSIANVSCIHCACCFIIAVATSIADDIFVLIASTFAIA